MTAIRNWNWSRILLWTGVGLLLLYMVVVPSVVEFFGLDRDQFTAPDIDELTLAQQIRIRSTEAVVILWFFTLGACIGSFLNVVVWRTPRGESLLFKKSACPACDTPILGKDNLPILGWLKLKGQCRNCASPISARYVIVELLTAALFTLFYFVELVSAGANLPERFVNSYAGVVWVLFYTKWDLVRLYLFHCLLFSALLSWALIDIDRQKIPRWLIAVTFGAVVGAVLTYPHLMPVPVLRLSDQYSIDYDFLHALSATSAGALAGMLLGLAEAFVLRSAGGTSVPDWRTSLGCHLVIGAALGWQAACGVALVAWSLWLLSRLVLWRRSSVIFPMSVCYVAGAIAHHVVWRLMYTNFPAWWPTATSDPVAVGRFVLASLGLLIADGFASRLSAADPK